MDDGFVAANRMSSHLPVLRRAAAWLMFLAPFFYLTYGGANWVSAQRENVGSIVFDWERNVPFLAWTIIPYWSINLFYGLSLAINRTVGDVNRLAGRYLTAQLVAVVCFMLFPLAATFVRPATDGLPGFLFAVLGGFDKPFNQAPSLHIALLVIIWDHVRRHLRAPFVIVWHVWCVLIGVSVLTTWQHHFIDVPTGALLGLFALWLFPAEGTPPLAGARLTRDARSRRLAVLYGSGAALLLAAVSVDAQASPLWLILLWPSLALAIVAFGYATGQASAFQKRADGSLSLASCWLLWPHRMGAWINSQAWTRKLAANVEIADGVHLGRFPTAEGSDAFTAVIDLSAELKRPCRAKCRWLSLPMLDLVAPDPGQVRAAARAVEDARRSGRVLVCCALGFQRSASVVAEWLVMTGRAGDTKEAAEQLARSGRRVHLHTARP